MTVQEAQGQAAAEACTVEYWDDRIGHRGQPAMLAVYYGQVRLVVLADPVVAAMDEAEFGRLIRRGRRAMEYCDGEYVV